MRLKTFIFAAIMLTLLAIPIRQTLSAQQSDAGTIVLTNNNVISVAGEITPESVAQIILKAKELDAALDRKSVFGQDKAPIYLFVNTPGGDVQAGLELFEALNGLGRPVHTITLFAASMGFQLVQNMGDRLILKNGILMSHRARGGFQGEFGGMRPSQVDSRYNFWLQRIQELDEKTVERTNGKQTLESYQKSYASEMWLTGKVATEQGYADKVVTAKCGKSLTGVTHQSLTFMGVEITYDLDNCPLNTGPMNIKANIGTTKGLMDARQFQASGGMFGPACLATVSNDASKLCALDTGLTLVKIEEIKDHFVNSYINNSHKVIPMY